MGCFKIVEGFVKYRVGRRVRSDKYVVSVRVITLNINEMQCLSNGRVVGWQLKQSRNSPTHIPR